MKSKKFITALLGLAVLSSMSLSSQCAGLSTQLVAATTTTTTDSTDDDAWKDNTGTITLGSTITCTGSGVSVSGTTINITEGGDFTVTGTLSNGMINVNTDAKVKLRLNGATISNSNGPAICFTNAKKAFITLEAGTTNTLSDGSNYSTDDAKAALFSNDTLEIKGKGTLYVTGNYKHGIASDDDILIENGTIHVTSSAGDGIHVNDDITITGGTVNVTSTQDEGIDSEGTLNINGGSVTVSAGNNDGIKAESDLAITAGTVNVTQATEGIESKAAINVSGGDISITCSDDCMNAAGNLTISGGNIYAYSTGNDSIDSNGSMAISGGTIVAIGTRAPECSFDAEGGSLKITGGTIVGIAGQSNSIDASNSQPSVVLGSYSANSLLHIEDASGNSVLTFKIPTSYETMLFSSPDLALNTSYTVYTGGSISGADEFHGLYTGGTYSNGSQSTSFTISSAVTQLGGSIFGGGGMGGGMGGGPSFGGGSSNRPGSGSSWGNNPWASSTPTATPVATATPTPEATSTPTATIAPEVTTAPTEVPETTSTPSGSAGLAATVSNNSSATTQTISSNIQLTATDDQNYDLSKVTLRYYFTSENDVNQSVYCDNASISYNTAPWYVSCTSDLVFNVVTMDTPTADANRYIEISFPNSSASLNQTGILNLALRMVNDDWSNFDQTNDYSYINSAVEVYYDGVCIQ